MSKDHEKSKDRHFKIKIPNGIFKLSPEKAQEIKSIDEWLKRSKESLKHKIVGKPVD